VTFIITLFLFSRGLPIASTDPPDLEGSFNYPSFLVARSAAIAMAEQEISARFAGINQGPYSTRESLFNAQAFSPVDQ
jgi:hypothetical protein